MKKFELSIPKPCYENWNAMTPEDKGRFCDSCQKTVIDFSGMSDRQVAEFFKKPAGSVCGRFHQDQLQRSIEMPRKRLPWIKHFFTIALPAFLLTLKAGAQRDTRLVGKVAVCEKPSIKGDTLITPAKSPQTLGTEPVRIALGMVLPKRVEQARQDTVTIISGRVADENGNPLRAASIFLANTKLGTTTDAHGNFSLRVNQPIGVLEVSLVGFNIQRIKYEGQSLVSIILQESKTELMGELIIVPVKKKQPIPLMPARQIDTAFSKFSIFPNPVTSNSTFNIRVKDLEDGRYLLSILTSTGELVQTKDIVLSKKVGDVSVRLDNIPAAPYFVRLTNNTNNKTYTEIILVK